jgi:hypothetical protein
VVIAKHYSALLHLISLLYRTLYYPQDCTLHHVPQSYSAITQVQQDL